MKRIFIALMLAMTLCTVAWAQTKNIANDTVVATTDTTYVAEYEDSVTAEVTTPPSSEFSAIFGSNLGEDVIVPIVAIVFGCSIPVLILFFAFFFRYKNRQAKYRIVEEALKAGQPLPEGIFKETQYIDMKSKGIKNIFTGIGLFIFLWAITGEFGVGSIGLLVMFIGIGQWIIDRQKPKNEGSSPFDTDKNDNAELK